MKFALFYHSVRSDWNHGNAHFLRGVVRALEARGHEVVVHEPEEGWSVANLRAEQGEAALALFDRAFPDIVWQTYRPERFDAATAVGDADVVVVHEWNDPAVVAALGQLRASRGGVRLLFHDTHHRMVSEPDAMRAFDLDGYDGILAFGAVLARAYERAGWGRSVHTWHEAADVTTFYPRHGEPRHDLVWVGNWGDDERTQELETYLMEPVRRLGASLAVHGVRYPDEALEALARLGADYLGWIPGPQVPEAFARARVTVHVPRRWYREQLVGIPTIRVFEALACGIPLVSAPWHDEEGLFRAGEDLLMAEDGEAMTAHLARLLNDPAEARELAERGRDRILARHTCDHRARELEDVLAGLDLPAAPRRMTA